MLLFFVRTEDAKNTCLILPCLILLKKTKTRHFPIALCWKFRPTPLASDSPSSSYRRRMVVVRFRIEAIAVALARGGDNICQGCWLIPHFNATLSRLNLKVTFCGGVKLWKRASPDIFVLHLGAKHHLCHYITARNGFTDEQHKILPAEMCCLPPAPFFFGKVGLMVFPVKLTATLMSQILRPLLLRLETL